MVLWKETRVVAQREAQAGTTGGGPLSSRRCAACFSLLPVRIPRQTPYRVHGPFPETWVVVGWMVAKTQRIPRIPQRAGLGSIGGSQQKWNAAVGKCRRTPHLAAPIYIINIRGRNRTPCPERGPRPTRTLGGWPVWSSGNKLDESRSARHRLGRQAGGPSHHGGLLRVVLWK